MHTWQSMPLLNEGSQKHGWIRFRVANAEPIAQQLSVLFSFFFFEEGTRT